MTRNQYLQLAMLRIRDHDDSATFGRDRDFDYLSDPYAVAERRGTINGRRVA